MQRFFNHSFPSGKLVAQNTRNPIKAQQGYTCLLKSLRRIAALDQENTSHFEAYKEIKNIMQTAQNIKLNDEKIFNQLFLTGNEICKKYNIDFKQNAMKDSSFLVGYNREKKYDNFLTIEKFLDIQTPYKKCALLYSVLLENILMPLMNVCESQWNPHKKNGFNTLNDSLKSHGPHLFIGRFGKPFYLFSKPKTYAPETTDKCTVFTYDKDAYHDDPTFIPHWIMVERVDMVQNKEMVFYRDPIDASDPSQPEKVYMMSYQAFVNRLTDRMGYLSDKALHDNDITFGLVSININKHF